MVGLYGLLLLCMQRIEHLCQDDEFCLFIVLVSNGCPCLFFLFIISVGMPYVAGNEHSLATVLSV